MAACISCKGKRCDHCCSLCQSAVFCSDQCETVGWAAHDCGNVIDVPDKKTTIFVPYFGEENMTEEMISDSMLQNHLLRYVDPKGTIEQCLVESLVGLDVTPEEFEIEGDLKYEIGLEIGDKEYIIPNLTTQTTLISEENKNSIYSRLAKNRPIGFPSFWPGKNAVKNVTIPNEPTLVTVTAGNLIMQAILDVSIPIPSDPKRNRVLTPIQNDYKTKYGDLKPNLRAYRATDDVGNGVIFILDNKNQLVDLELTSPSGFEEDSEYEYEKVRFAIDPTNLAHVTGLVMALEDKLASGLLESTPNLQKQFGLINQYREDLENGKMTQPNAQINAAIRGTTEQLWDLVERRTLRGFLRKKRADKSRSESEVGKHYRQILSNHKKAYDAWSKKSLKDPSIKFEFNWPDDNSMLEDFRKYVNAASLEQGRGMASSANLDAAEAIDAVIRKKKTLLGNAEYISLSDKFKGMTETGEFAAKQKKFQERNIFKRKPKEQSQGN